MTHEDAFLQAIIENPDDDLRLVYADWLATRDGGTRGQGAWLQAPSHRPQGDSGGTSGHGR